jgi:hypothetical protein
MLRRSAAVALTTRAVAASATFLGSRAAALDADPSILTADSGVMGLNGETFPNGVTAPQSFTGTCTVCHHAPNVGNHSVKAPLDIGLSDPKVARYLSVHTVRNLATGETIDTTDLGRAMITGKWRDIGKFKGPVLRGLAARAPYFHNGSAATLEGSRRFLQHAIHHRPEGA